jgi:hypothetical protein
MELLRAKMVQLIWKEARLCARLGLGDAGYPAGYGSTVPEALRDLARVFEESAVTVWVSRPGTVFTADGV